MANVLPGTIIFSFSPFSLGKIDSSLSQDKLKDNDIYPVKDKINQTSTNEKKKEELWNFLFNCIVYLIEI